MLLARYSEIGLKGKNRGFFEKKLIENIKNKIGNVKIERDSGSVLLHANDAEPLKEVFGIGWFAKVNECKLDLEEIKQSALQMLKEKKPKSFRITASRSNKKFPIKSNDLEMEVGKFCEQNGFDVSLKNFELEIFADILERRALVYAEKQQGLGGLPVSTSGKVLCLLSGGIDSPVAAILMAKRGCTVDFLHFYALRSTDEVRKSKIPRLVSQIEKFCGKTKLFLAPFADFQVSVLEKGEYELQLFRRFMVRVTELFAKENCYSAIIMGDNLNQVASQTLENLTAVQVGIEMPIFRPLLAFDKNEIILLAKKFGTYEISIEDYKDCCSIIVKKPKTKISQEKLLELEKEIEIGKIVSEVTKKIKLL